VVHSLEPEEAARLERRLNDVQSLDAVVHYCPEPPDGYFLLSRLGGDDDIVYRWRSDLG
jgi:hypothetical protein